MSKRRIGTLGSGALSRALGASDPRIRRNALAALETPRNVNESLEVDAKQRLRVKKATAIDAFSDTSTATAEDVAAKLNELLAALRAAGHMED